MKGLQLLTFVTAILPHCTTALFLNTGISSYPNGLYNQSTTSSIGTPSTSSAGAPIVPTNSASPTSGPLFPVRPIHQASFTTNFSSNGHIDYYASSGAYIDSGFPKPTGAAGTSSSSSAMLPLGGTSSSVPPGIFASSGTDQGTVSGTGVTQGNFSSGTDARLTASGGGNSSVPTRAASCGSCDVIIPQVQIQYFPDSKSPGTCTQGPGAGPSITPPPAPALVKRRLARRNGTFTEDIAVSDGYTFTAPSMYVVMSQGIQVTDLCGTIGSSLSSAIVPVSAGSLSTLSYNLAEGVTLSNAMATASTYTKALLPEDLACPTWGISGNWNPRPWADPLAMPGGAILNIPAAAAPGATTLAVIGLVEVDTHVGAPWYPIIVLPHEVLGLDPLWQSCQGRLVNPAFPIFDPPHPLSAETILVSSTAPVGLAPQTVAPGGGGVVDVVKIPESRLITASPLALAPPVTTAQAPANTAAAVNAPNSIPAAIPASPVITANPPADNPAPQNQAPGNPVNAPATSTINVVPVAANNPTTPNPPVANVKAPAQNAPVATAPIPLTVAGQQVQQQGSHLIVGGQSIAPGSTGSVSGHQVVNNGNNVVVDGSSQAVQPNPTPAPAPLPPVAGQSIQQQGSNVVIAGQTIAPGSTGSVGGHAVVNQGHNVVVDGSSHAIQPTPAPVLVAAPANNAPSVAVVTPAFQGEGGNVLPNSPVSAAVPLPSVAGQPIHQQGSDLVVAGQTIAPGASAIVAGHQVVNNVNNGHAVVVDGNSQAIPPPSITPAALPSVGGQPISQKGSDLVVAGQTIAPGASAIVAGHQVVNNVNNGHAVVVDGSSQALPPAGITPAPAAAPAITIGGNRYTADSSSNFVINGQTLNPSNPITVSGTPISILPGDSAVAIGSSTQAIVTPPPTNNANSPAQSRPPLTVGGSTYYPTGPSSAYVLPGGQTLKPGGQITVAGIPVSLAPDGSVAVVGSSTENLAPTITPPPGQPALTFDGTTYHPITGAPSDYIVGSQTLTPGGVITVSGTPISLATDGASAIIGSSTQNLQMTEPPLTFDGSTYYATGSSSAYVIDGQTITPGALVTISGTPISLASDGASAVVGTSTEDLQPSLTAGAVLTVGGQTFTPNPSSFVLGGKTMTVGGSAIISGTPVALEPSGTLMVGTSRIPLASASGKLIAPSSQPLTGSVVRKNVPWTGLAMGILGTGFLYIV